MPTFTSGRDTVLRRLWSRRLVPLAIAVSIAGAIVAVPRAATQEAGQIPTVTNNDAGGYRLWVLLFDVSSMQTDEVARAKAAALKWIDTGMSFLLSPISLRSTPSRRENTATRAE